MENSPELNYIYVVDNRLCPSAELGQVTDHTSMVSHKAQFLDLSCFKITPPLAELIDSYDIDMQMTSPYGSRGSTC